MKAVIAAILLLSVPALAVDTVRVGITDFSPGLNTVKSDRAMLPGESRIAKNVDLNDAVGALTVRDGYDSLFTIAGQDSLLWNMPMVVQYSDGSKEMLLVSDSSGVGYANIYRSAKNTVNFNTIDSFLFCPDTGLLVDSAQAATYQLWMHIVLSDTTWADTLTIDTTSDKSVIVDSLLALINAGTAGGWVTATKNDDTLILVEDASNLAVQVVCTTYSDANSGDKMLADSLWEAGSISPDRIATYVPATGTPQYAVFRDKTYIVNGVGRGTVYDGKNTQPFPLQAPGEILAVPVTDTGSLNGRYRYAIRAVGDSVIHADSLIAPRWGYLSQPIIVDSSRILLYGFPRRTYDWRYSSEDSITYEIWRTVGTVGKLDKLDSMFNTGLTVTVDSANYTTVTVTDSIPDATIRSNDGRIIVDGDYYEWKSDIDGGDDYTLYRRPGEIGFYGHDSITTGAGIWSIDGDSAVGWSTCAGFSILVVAVDTAQLIPSDSGVSFNFYQPGTPSTYDSDTNKAGTSVGFARQETERLRYIMPRGYNSDVLYQIYRGPIEALQFDTISGGLQYDPRTGHAFNWSLWSVNWGKDYFIPYYYYVGQFNAGDTVYDTLSYADLVDGEGYTRNAIPAVANAVTAFDSRLFLADGSYVQRSTALDTTTGLLSFNRTPINPDDGDQITAMWPQKGVLRVAKTKSMYSLYQSGGAYIASELSGHYGALSPFSHANASEGDYFLSHDGVRLEDEGIYKERSFIGSLMSSQLKSFTSQPIPTLRQSVGIYYDDKYLLCVPSLDTTWVLHKIPMPDGRYRYSWATWDIEFSGAALYSVSASNDFIPPDSLYFTKPGSSSLYRFGSSTTDNGQSISWIWKSGPVGPMDGNMWRVDEVGLWSKSTDTIDYAVECRFVNDSFVTATDSWGLALGSETVRFGALNDKRYRRRRHISSSLSLYWQPYLTSSTTYDATGTTVIDGLELLLTRRGASQSQ